MLNSAARLADYTDSNGQPLELDIVFEPENITAFVAFALGKGKHRWRGAPLTKPMLKRVVSDVERIGRALNPRAGWSVERPEIGRTKVKAPHTKVEELGFFRTARNSTSIHHLAVVVLGFGCGLDGRWQPRITRHQVELRSGAYWVHADEPDRWIPLPDRYFDDMARVLSEVVDDGPLIGGESTNNHRTSRVTERISKHSQVRLEPARMRSSWFVRHLNNRTDLQFLLEMAGLKSMTTIWDLMAFVTPVEETTAVKKARRA